MKREVYIVEAVRTPIGKRGGSLSGLRSEDLAAVVLRGVLERAGVEAGEVEDVVMGCVTQVGEQGFNVARNAVLVAGFPIGVPGTTVNRLCGSSQQAFAFASQAIASGEMDLVIAAGVESMSRVEMGSDMGSFHVQLRRRFDLVPQGVSAELVAQKWELGRRELDEFSYSSHRKALRAQLEGDFGEEIVPVAWNGGVVERDEGPRSDTSLEKLAALKTVFLSEAEGGRITAGSSSQISDGAAAILLASGERVKELGLRPRARVVANAVAGTDPTLMLTGPIDVTRKILSKTGIGLEEIDWWEVNEAFASVVLAFAKEVGVDLEKINLNGGAIALGHPLGCSGVRLLTTLVHGLERRKLRYGLATMCIGMGQGTATILERVG